MISPTRCYIRAEIVRWVSDDFPGFVEARFTDRWGREWSVVDKVPVIAADDFWADSPLPQPAFLACTIVSRDRDDTGRETADVSTIEPWGIETVDEVSTFQVWADQLTTQLA